MSAAAFTPPPRWNPDTDLAQFDAILFDCDGVLWHETTAVSGASATLRALQQQGKLLLFATNNSGKSREDYMKKFPELGFDFELTADHIFTSSQATAHYLANLPVSAFDPATQCVLTVGESGIGVECRARGLRCLETRELFGKNHLSKDALSKQQVDETIGAVVVGIDAELTYSKIAYALACLNRPKDAQGDRNDTENNRAVLFVSTNQDSTLPTGGHTLPGAGACVAMLATASGRTPVNIGKPETGMLDLAVEKFKLDRSRLLMIGDRLDTDIQFGLNGGVASLLVTATGIHSMHDVKRSNIRPTFVLDNVTQLLADKKA